MKKNLSMYTETHHLHNRYTALLKWGCAGIAVFQLPVLAGSETGLPWAPLGLLWHLLLLLLAGTGFLLATQITLGFRVSDKGWEMRYFPYHRQYRFIPWKEIRHARLLLPGTAPSAAPFGYPGQNFTHIYLLTHPQYAVLQLDLVSGVQLFISVLHAPELLDYLQHDLVRSRLFVRTSLKPMV